MATTINPNEFKDLYKAWPSEHLLHILSSKKEKYQREAVYAAEQVLQERGVDYKSVQDLDELQAEIEERLARGEKAKTPKAWQILLVFFIVIQAITIVYRLSR